MGEVYRASDDRLAREVALKVLKPALANDQDRLRRFELEARSSAALSHPNIVAVYDIGMHDGAPYIVSELLQGETLRQRLLQGQLSLRQTTDYGMQIAQGLIAAHEKRIVHRDLKPENLFITKDGHIKILDFGIAKLTWSEVTPESGEERSLESLTTQTRSGSVLGTVSYMSPEQVRGKPVDHRSDIFSFGAILYEMLTAKRAFKGETDVDTMMAVLKEDPPEMALERQSIPPAFEQIVQHCLEKEPGNRFQSARDLNFALSTVSDVTSKKFPPLRPSRPLLRKWLPGLAAVLLLAVGGIFLGATLKPAVAPQYRRITFERGTVHSARFSPDGRSILYGASWNGRPLELYSTVGDSPLARPLGFTSAHLLALSSTNELALVLHGIPDRRDFTDGVLARAPLAGGTPRELLEDVQAADWSQRGDLAVVHRGHNGENRLEYPIGKVLYHTSGGISDLRFSPAGDRIAFMDHPVAFDDRGSVCVIDLDGHKTTLSSGWRSEDGLAWSPAGDQVWFTAAGNDAGGRALWAVDLSGRQRKILAVPGDLTLHDIASDGRVLIGVDTDRGAMEWVGKNDKDVRDLSWYDWSLAKDITPDGKWVLFEESSEPAGPNYAVAIRNIDGSPPIRLGEGTVGNLSPDGKWAISVFTGSPQHISLYPVGPGQARQIFIPELEHLENGSAEFLPDGQQIIVNGNEPGHAVRTFVVQLAGGKPRAITPEGVTASIPSPDGRYVVGREGSGPDLTLFPIASGTPVSVRFPTGLAPIRWSTDSRALYVYSAEEISVKIERFEIATGKLTELRQVTPADRAGVVRIAPMVAAPDASEFAYTYYQTLSVLYVVSGLR